MTKSIAVARWEYIERVRSKAFLISLFLTPLLMVGVSVVPAILAARMDSEPRIVGLIDASGEVLVPLTRKLEDRFRLPNGQPNYLLRPIAVPAGESMTDAEQTADSLSLAEVLEGYLVVGKEYLRDTTFDYRSPNVGNLRLTENLRSALRDVIVAKKLRMHGMDPELVGDLTKTPDLRTIKLSKTGKDQESGFGEVFFTGYIFMMMMFILIMTSGQILVRSMVEEKSNRVVEVLMSSCSARDLMAGKIIGLSGLGITQLGFWVIIGLSLSSKYAIPMLPVPTLLLLLLYIILGYLLYAAIFVAGGAPVSTEQEAQQVTSYLVIILIIPIALAFSAAQNPNMMLIKVLSYIPLLTPSMMLLRIPNQMPSLPELAITLVLLVLSIIIMMRIAAKIFRTTILLTGKRPGLKELLVLLRTR